MSALEYPASVTSRSAPLSDPEKPVTRGLALVVDDKQSNRMLLKALLVKEGFRVILAEDGEQGVERFEKEGADIVFMDVLMPGIGGYEATRRIKSLAGAHFVPVIFLTALTDKDALVKCLEVGGDDFLTKPYDHEIFKAKMLAAERTRDLHRKIREQHKELSVLHGYMQRELEIAEQIFTNAVAAPNIALDSIQSLLRPAATFNGDLLLTAWRPSGELNILLGDFTGHGLTAAVGALPVSEVFRAMTKKGFAASDILEELNNKLSTLLPVDMFMAACFLTVDTESRSAAVWNGGMPDILVVSKEGAVLKSLPSVHRPLGISGSLEKKLKAERVELNIDDHILLLSDGLLDARDPDGQMFGQTRLEQLVQSSGSGAAVFGMLTEALDDFCQDCPQDDDITLVSIPCRPELVANGQEKNNISTEPRGNRGNSLWQWSLELHGSGLRTTDPVPLAVAQFQELQHPGTQREVLYTVLSELFSNALDHGVLGLSSASKNSAEGFSSYYAEREKRLSVIDEGYVRIGLAHLPEGQGGRLTIRVEDSGEGFDYRTVFRNAELNLSDNAGYAGRGIPLLKELCESLRFEGTGNCVEAVYVWG